jgi:hypothetical protein
MYIRSSTRKNSSARSSQRGIRSGAGGTTSNAGEAASACPGWEAGLAGNESDIDSGCWDILGLRAPPFPDDSPALAEGPETPARLRDAVLQR